MRGILDWGWAFVIAVRRMRGTGNALADFVALAPRTRRGGRRRRSSSIVARRIIIVAISSTTTTAANPPLQLVLLLALQIIIIIICRGGRGSPHRINTDCVVK